MNKGSSPIGPVAEPESMYPRIEIASPYTSVNISSDAESIGSGMLSNHPSHRRDRPVFHYPHSRHELQHPVPVLSYLSPTQISAVSGALSGFLAGVAVCPLDVAKTRLQAQGVVLRSSARSRLPNMKYKGIFNTLRVIYSEEGVRGLYRGLVPITIGYLPTWMIYFTVYEKAKVIYPQAFRDLFNIDVYHNNPFFSFVSYSLSAMTAGAASTTLTNPIWVVKTRLMLQTGNGHTVYESVDPDHKTSLSQPKQSQNYYNGTVDAFRKMYRNEGLRVFYSGLVPSLFGLFHVAIHFPVYEMLKRLLKCNINDSTNKMRILENNDKQAKQERFYFFLKLILASSLSKMVASTLTYPHEVLRTRLQIRSLTSSVNGKGAPAANDTLDKSKVMGVQSNSVVPPKSKSHLLQTIKSIYFREGLKGFYSGYCTNLTRTVPSSAVTLVSFEFIKIYFERINCLDSEIDKTNSRILD